jgi:hypothetical protein
MATILDNPNCGDKYGNVGTPSCAIGIKYLNGFIITEDGYEVSNANLASWSLALAALKTSTLAPVGQRIFPFFNIIGLTDNTPAPEKKTSGYGVTTQIVEKLHSFEIEIKDFGGAFFKEMRKFNGRKDLRFFWVDTDFIGGEQTSTGLKGFRASVFAKQVKVGNVADYTKYMLEVELTDPSALTDKLVSIPVPETVTLSSELTGILNVTLTGTPSATSKTANVVIETAISRTNLFDEYSADLSATGAWSATDLTSVVADPATKSFNLLFGTSGAKSISLKTPAELAALNVGGNGTSGFESDTVSVTVIA